MVSSDAFENPISSTSESRQPLHTVMCGQHWQRTSMPVSWTSIPWRLTTSSNDPRARQTIRYSGTRLETSLMRRVVRHGNDTDTSFVVFCVNWIRFGHLLISRCITRWQCLDKLIRLAWLTPPPQCIMVSISRPIEFGNTSVSIASIVCIVCIVW